MSVGAAADGWTRSDPAPIPVTGPAERWLGRYRLCFELAAGGMATVYLARAQGAAGFDKPVALKRIHPHLARERVFVEMFLDEARIASQIDHANVCTVFDFGDADGAYFMTMEYLVGESLARVARALSANTTSGSGRDRAALVARVIADAAEGLHAAHELRSADGTSLGVVHRDVSPQNIFVTYDGTIKIVDFGIASAENRLHRTATGHLKGKIAYIAPEQVDGDRADRRADVFSLGVVAWELATGERLFRRSSDGATLRAVLEAPIAVPSAYDEALPPSFDAIVMRALDRDPARRYATARDLARDLTRFLGEERLAVGAAEVAEWMERLFPGAKGRKKALVQAAVEMTAAGAAGAASRRPLWRTRRRRSRSFGRWALVATVAAVAGLGAALGMSQGLSGARTASDAAVAHTGNEAAPPAAGRAVGAASAPPPIGSALAASAEPAPDSANRDSADPEATESTGPDSAETTRPRRPRHPPPRAREAPAAPEAGVGRVYLVTPGGWADVYLGGQRIGESPGVVELEPGRHTLELRPFGQAPYVRRVVRVRAGQTTRVRVPVSSP